MGNKFFDAEKISCRVCKSDRLIKIGECLPFAEGTLSLFPDSIESEDVRGYLYRCSKCGLGQRIPCLNEEQLRELYRGLNEGQMDYDFTTNGAWVASRKLLRRYWQDDAHPLILDVGCYEGRFLRGLPESWHKFGIEPSLQAKVILEKHKIKVISDFLTSSPSEWHKRFDVICMFDVFEHLHNPYEGLINALKYLKPGGRLFVSTADMDSWTWKWLNTDHWYLESPFHLSFGTKSFFQWFCQQVQVKLSNICYISHRLGTPQQIFSDAVIATYFGLRRRGGIWRLPQRIIQSIPAWN